MKRTYEFVVVLSPELDARDTNKISDIVKKLLSDASVSISKIDTMGKKVLAYPIRKFKEGVYVISTIEGENVSVGAIENKTKLEPLVLRYLLIRK